MEEIAALVLCTIPTIWEIWNDRKGETRKDKARDFVIAVIIYSGIALASLWLFVIPVAKSLALMLAIRVMFFDYAIQYVLIKRGVITGHWFTYTGKTAYWDKVTAKINPWVRLVIRVMILCGVVLWFINSLAYNQPKK